MPITNIADNRKVIMANEVFLYRVKAPFSRSGKSIKGALEYNPEDDTVRCHECGKWFKSLPAHFSQKHRINAKEYKTKHGLSSKAALVSERLRTRSLETWIRSGRDLSELREAKLARRARPATPVYASGWSVEKKNLRGSCQAQLLERLKTLTERLGHSPTIRELRQDGIAPYTLCATFNVDTINDVYSLLKMPLLPQSPHKGRQYSKELLIELLRDFFVKHQRLPYRTDYNRGLIPSVDQYRRHFGSKEAAYWEAGLGLVCGVVPKPEYWYEATQSTGTD